MSQETDPSKLRMLAKDYADGRIRRDEYLRERTAFLDALGSQGLRRTRPMKATSHPSGLAPAPAPAVRNARGAVSPPSKIRRSPALAAAIGIGLTLLLGAGAGFLLLNVNEPAQDVGTRTADDFQVDQAYKTGFATRETAGADDQAEAADRGIATVADIADELESFLDEANWGAAGIAAREQLVDRWRDYPPETQKKARSEPAFRRLERELLETLEVERALGKSDYDFASLLVFARDLGIEVDTSDLPAEQVAGISAGNSVACRPGDECPPSGTTATPRTFATNKTTEQRVAASRSSDEATLPEAMLRTGPSPTNGTGPASADSGGTPDSTADVPARPSTPSDASAQGPTAPPLALASRLPAADRSDICARTAERLNNPETPTYSCRDHFMGSGRGKGPELAVIPGRRAPFAVTTKSSTLTTLQEWWCFRQRAPCAGSTDTAAQGLNDTQIRAQQPVQIPDNPQALARDYASWLSDRTGYDYHVATQAELREAARYGFATGTGIRLVRQLTLTQGSKEAKALERWWHYHQTATD